MRARSLNEIRIDPEQRDNLRNVGQLHFRKNQFMFHIITRASNRSRFFDNNES